MINNSSTQQELACSSQTVETAGSFCQNPSPSEEPIDNLLTKLKEMLQLLENTSKQALNQTDNFRDLKKHGSEEWVTTFENSEQFIDLTAEDRQDQQEAIYNIMERLNTICSAQYNYIIEKIADIVDIIKHKELEKVNLEATTKLKDEIFDIQQKAVDIKYDFDCMYFELVVTINAERNIRIIQENQNTDFKHAQSQYEDQHTSVRRTVTWAAKLEHCAQESGDSKVETDTEYLDTDEDLTTEKSEESTKLTKT